MKERQILFSAPMVRAILDGRKTQTRRMVKPPRGWADKYPSCDPFAMPPSVWWWNGVHERVGVRQECPYGQPGDRLWVREAFRLFDAQEECACYDLCVCSRHHGKPVYRADEGCGESKWKPSIHMPRWASRILLEMVSVRVERLQNISEEDAASEGAPCELGRLEGAILGAQASYRKGFIRLWESINGEGSWIENPWVWVVEFKVVEPKS